MKDSTIEDIDQMATLDELFGEISGEDLPQASGEEDTMTLEEFDALVGQADIPIQAEEAATSKTSSDIFSDSLSAVSSLEDEVLEEQFNNLLPEDENAKGKKKRKSFWQKIFGNIEPENPEEEIAAAKAEEVKKEQDQKNKEEGKQKKKDEKAKAAAEKKAAQAAAKDAKAKQKAEEKAKKQKEKEEKEKEEREKAYIPEGKINKVGASIVLGITAVAGVVIIIGSLKGSSKLVVKNAAFDSSIGRYSEAYEGLSGMKLSKSDQELYNELKTIMYMNKQQKSFTNFLEMGMYVEALDSLLKGLERYDTYYEQAKEYGVVEEYDKMKTQMLAELKQTFGLTETKAKSLIAKSDGVSYTKELTKICSSMEKSAESVASTSK